MSLLRDSAAARPVLDADYPKPPKAEVQALDAALLLTTVLEMLGFSARAAGGRLTVDMPRGLRLLGDRSHLRQVLLNLATTAIEAVGRGGLVTLAARPGEDRQIILEIADNGPGIPPDVEARIREPFFTTKTEGTGLGLAIVRSLVKEMGGTIQLESAPRRGTLCRLSFPTAPEEPDQNPGGCRRDP